MSTGVILFAVIAVGYGAWLFIRWWIDRRRRVDETFSDPDYSIEVDCRACSQFNRVSSHRLRDRPKCGRCKARLMPGKHLVICRVSPLDRDQADELNAVWTDEDRLWQSLADYVAIKQKAHAEEQDPKLRVVN